MTTGQLLWTLFLSGLAFVFSMQFIWQWTKSYILTGLLPPFVFFAAICLLLEVFSKLS